MSLLRCHAEVSSPCWGVMLGDPAWSAAMNKWDTKTLCIESTADATSISLCHSKQIGAAAELRASHSPGCCSPRCRPRIATCRRNGIALCDQIPHAHSPPPYIHTTPTALYRKSKHCLTTWGQPPFHISQNKSIRQIQNGGAHPNVNVTNMGKPHSNSKQRNTHAGLHLCAC